MPRAATRLLTELGSPGDAVNLSSRAISITMQVNPVRGFAVVVPPAVNTMPIMYPWQPSVSPLPVLQFLEAGGCVVLPTESTYEIVASALQPEAVARLHALAGDNVPAIVVSDDGQLPNWMPLLRGVGARLY